MGINFKIPEPSELKPRLVVFGVGGAGGNAVNNMIEAELQGVEFVVANTDSQAMARSRAEQKLQLGVGTTQGLGAGSKPDVGASAAEESISDIREKLEGSHMAFIAAGMGGGTGTGAAPVIAQTAREMGILTVGVVTRPFKFEGSRRSMIADAGIEELQKYVDTLIIIPNQNLFCVANEKTSFAEAFKMADDVLKLGVRSVTDLIVMEGLVNLDFADVKTIMSEMGKAMMGTGEASGDTRAVQAAEAAISNPLLEDASMAGATGVLVNITGGMDMTLYEVDEVVNRIRDEAHPEANIIFGSTFDMDMEGSIRVSVIATGIDHAAEMAMPQPRITNISLDAKPTLKPEPVVEAAAPVMMEQPEPVAEEPSVESEVAMEEAAPEFLADALDEDAADTAITAEPEGEVPVQPSMFQMPEMTPQRAPAAEYAPEQPAPQHHTQQQPQAAKEEFFKMPRPVEPKAAPQHSASQQAKKRGALLSFFSRDKGDDMPGKTEAAPVAQQAMPSEGMARPVASSAVSAAPAAQPKGEVGGKAYDIPAFLRRQAN